MESRRQPKSPQVSHSAAAPPTLANSDVPGEKADLHIKWWTSAIGKFGLEHVLNGNNQESRRWRTTLIRFGPLSGILCMVLALASIFATLGILAGSNKQPVDNWSAPTAVRQSVPFMTRPLADMSDCTIQMDANS